MEAVVEDEEQKALRYISYNMRLTEQEYSQYTFRVDRKGSTGRFDIEMVMANPIPDADVVLRASGGVNADLNGEYRVVDGEKKCGKYVWTALNGARLEWAEPTKDDSHGCYRRCGKWWWVNSKGTYVAYNDLPLDGYDSSVTSGVPPRVAWRSFEGHLALPAPLLGGGALHDRYFHHAETPGGDIVFGILFNDLGRIQNGVDALGAVVYTSKFYGEQSGDDCGDTCTFDGGQSKVPGARWTCMDCLTEHACGENSYYVFINRGTAYKVAEKYDCGPEILALLKPPAHD